MFATKKYLFKKLGIFCLKLLFFNFINKFPKLNWRLKYFRISLNIFETFTNLKLILINFIIEIGIYIDHTLYLYILICFLSFNVALPKFIKLFQMQILKVLFANFWKSSVNYFLHFLFKQLFLRTEYYSLFRRIITYLCFYPRHTTKTFLLFII